MPVAPWLGSVMIKRPPCGVGIVAMVSSQKRGSLGQIVMAIDRLRSMRMSYEKARLKSHQTSFGKWVVKKAD